MSESRATLEGVEAPTTPRIAEASVSSDRILDLLLSLLLTMRRGLDVAIARLEAWRGRRFRPTVLAAMVVVALSAAPLTFLKHRMDLERESVAQEAQRVEFELVFAEAREKWAIDAQKRGLFTAAGVTEARARVAKLQARLKALGPR